MGLLNQECTVCVLTDSCMYDSCKRAFCNDVMCQLHHFRRMWMHFGRGAFHQTLDLSHGLRLGCVSVLKKWLLDAA